MLLPTSFVSHFVPDWHDDAVEPMGHGHPVSNLQSLGKDELSELHRGKKLAKSRVPCQDDLEDLRQPPMQGEGDSMAGVPAVEVPVLTMNNPSIQDDEMLSWLQYPVEDTLDRAYCSEYFGELLNPHVQLLKDSFMHQTMKETESAREGVLQSCGHTFTTKMAGQGQGQAPCAEGFKALNADSSLETGACRASILGGHTHVGKITEHEQFPCTEAFRAVNADTAMAMGAGRASGLFSQAGAETFSGVRITNHQPSAVVKPSLIPLPPVHTNASSNQRKALHHVDPISSEGSMGNFRTFTNVDSLAMKDKGDFQLPSTFMPFQGHLPVSNLGFHNPKKNSLSVVGASTSPPNSRRSSLSGTKEVSNSHELHLSVPAVPVGVPSSQGIEVRRESQNRFQDWYLPPLPVARSQKKSLDQHSLPVESVSGSGITNTERGVGTLETADTTTSPSRTSGNSNEKGSADDPAFLKKKSLLNEESDYQSEDFDDVAVSAKKPRAGRGTATKRSRAAETHNESEKRRRNKINVRMKALQELIPNANKTDKASMLDEVIEYMKMLQAQLQFMCMRTGMAVSPVSMPMPSGVQYISMQQMPTSPHVNNMGMGLGFGMGMGMGMVPAGLSAMDTSWQVALPESPSLGQPITSYQAAQFPAGNSPQPIHSSQGNLQPSSHAFEPRRPFSVHGLLQPFPANLHMNSDMYSTTSQLQQEHEMLK